MLSTSTFHLFSRATQQALAGLFVCIVCLCFSGCTIGDLFQSEPAPEAKVFNPTVTVTSDERHLDPAFFSGTRTEFLFDANAHPLAVIEYSLAGDPLVVTRYRQYTRRGDTLRVDSYVTYGADSTWLTTDDVTNGTTEYYTYSGLQIIQKVSLANFGRDFEQSWQTYDYDETGRLIELREYCCRLVEQDSFPEVLTDQPSLLERVRTYDYNTNTMLDTETIGGIDTIREWGLDGARFDQVALYAEGDIDSTATFTYDEDGYLTRIVRYSGPGSDAIWFTTDDIVDNYRAFDFNANGSLKTDESFLTNTGCDSTGADDQYLTDDDVACYTTIYTYSQPIVDPYYTFFIREPFLNPDAFWNSL